MYLCLFQTWKLSFLAVLTQKKQKKQDNFYRLSAVIDIDPALSKNIGPASAHHVIDSDQ